MFQVTNRDRADWARIAQDAFDAQVYFPGSGRSVDDVEPLSTRIKDLITGLTHLARLEAGVADVEAFVLSALRMHDMEAAEDPDSNEGDSDG
ncbi:MULTISPECIES: hypothetical protein [unclassified Sphingomonas]|uniref:hypothetical protein n=1 Tax=unclassified Sphingomonas TaxID=196159 RepID=UPI002151737C|nr:MULTISPECIES: hypothetical protein [unclassified Sphingomonas]MCR5870663.1 hypothetical protein [Sphingomonas sp. J344]UUY00999.1 hypothetical protein LRS08_08070 [Sphingomonas sp. J315]